MSDTKHALEHLRVEGDEIGYTSRDDDQSFGMFCPIGIIHRQEDARRIVACVNACAGIRTEALEHRCHLLKADDDQIATLSKQNEQLLSALYLALPFVEDHEGDEGYKPGAVSKAVSTIKAAIAAGEPAGTGA